MWSLARGLAPIDRCRSCGVCGSMLCRDCARSLPVPTSREPIAGVDKAIAPWAYEGPARDLILSLKVSGLRSAAAPLIRAMAAEAWAEGSDAEAICWVPGKPRDIRRRGFDHAAELARGLGAELGLPLIETLRRLRDPRDQASLGRLDRRANLGGVFAARPIRGVSRVAVVDDLITTGTTMAACAGALGGAGISQIVAISACRA